MTEKKKSTEVCTWKCGDQPQGVAQSGMEHLPLTLHLANARDLEQTSVGFTKRQQNTRDNKEP